MLVNFILNLIDFEYFLIKLLSVKLKDWLGYLDYLQAWKEVKMQF